VAGQILEEKKQHLQINIISFGYKYGLPLDSDLVFDTRFLPNPFYVDRLRNLNGKSKKVREFVLKSPETIEYLHHLQDFIDNQLPGFQKEGKSTLTISIGCTGGKHRSVVIAEALRNHFRQKKLEVKIIHRDIYK